ncbi:MAG TPA: TolC family protein [Terriglobia bacterium]|nr:TolC family protein [Terriglobia bacterium]
MKSSMFNSSTFYTRILLVTMSPLFSLSLFGQSQKELLTLEKAVALALDSNLLVKSARYSLEAANTRTQEANSSYWPKLNYDYSIARGDNPVFVFGGLLTQNRFTMENFDIPSLNKPAPLNNFQSRFSGSMNLFDFWRTRNHVALSRLNKQGFEKELDKTQSDLVNRVVKAYQDALLAQEFVKLAEEAVRSAEADQTKAEALFQAGLVVESDLLSVQVHKAAQAEELVKARNNMKLAYSNLNFEMGLALDQPFELALTLKPFVPDPLDLASYQKTALQQRPDFKQAELAAQSGETAIKAAKSDFWPVVSAFGQWETDQATFTPGAGNNYIYGINVHLNLFNGKADQVKLAESHIQQQRAATMRDYLAQVIRLQVQEAYLDLETAQQRIEVNQQSNAQAEESLRIIRNRYEAGLTNVTDLLRAEVALVAAKTNLLRAIFDQRVSAANLELQSGRLSRSSRIVVE